MSGSRNPIKRHPLIAFFVLAYAVAWGSCHSDPFSRARTRSGRLSGRRHFPTAPAFGHCGLRLGVPRR